MRVEAVFGRVLNNSSNGGGGSSRERVLVSK
jgi:hypothetical protein